MFLGGCKSLRGSTTGDDLFSSSCVCMCVCVCVCVCVWKRERDHGGTGAARNRNKDRNGKVSSVTDKKASLVGRFKRKVDKQNNV